MKARELVESNLKLEGASDSFISSVKLSFSKLELDAEEKIREF